jgi:choline dehydrogenase-like flavoprotein
MSDLFALGTHGVVGSVEDSTLDCDIAIFGSGMGGATLAWALRHSGARVLVVERGDFLPSEDANWSATEVFVAKRYRNAEFWHDAVTGRPFAPGVHYYVGGNTKVYGACLPRFRVEDFGVTEHRDGASPSWPIAYADLEPYYGEAERLFGVHGTPGDDPTEPWRSSDYPFPALEHEPAVAAFADSLRARGLYPFAMPSAVDWHHTGRCLRCKTCDGFPCRVDAKGDADVFALRPAIAEGNVRLLSRSYVARLEMTPCDQRVVEAVVIRDGVKLRLRAKRFVVACGAANSAALLLRSATDHQRHGLANSSNLVGRNYMVHNSTFLIGVDPRRRNTTSFQKTLGLNDWYVAGADTPSPLGNVQMLGKLQGSMLKSAQRWLPTTVANYLAAHSIDLYLTSEDLPDPENRVFLGPDGGIRVRWRPNNLTSHRELVRRIAREVRRAGYPLVLTQRMDIATNSHMCGTAVMGTDPTRSVLDPNCRAHDVENLWVVDSSSFPSSAAMNPALTIAANALRVAAKFAA